MSAPSSKFGSSREYWPVFFGLLGLCGLGNYLFCSQFGIYEDDFFFNLTAYQWKLHDLWENLKASWINWPQFRPLGMSLTYLTSYLTAQSDSLVPGYIFGLLLHSLNGFLLYKIARARLCSAFAFFAAALFLLYPSDGGKMILMLRIFQVFNLTMVLSAILLYMKGRRLACYIVACGPLLTYEHFFLPFLIAPFVCLVWDRRSVWIVVKHFAVASTLPIALILLRRHFGDDRASGVVGAPVETLYKMFSASLIGPRTAMQALFTRPWDAFFRSDFLQWTTITMSALGSMYVFKTITLESPVKAESAPNANVSDLHAQKRLLLLLVGCVLCLPLCYILAIRPDNYPPIVTLGRLSGFNAPGSIPASLLCATLLQLLVDRIPSARSAALVAIATTLGLLVSWGITVQRLDYVRNWNQQRRFWEQILATSGEWKPGTQVVVNIDTTSNREFYTAGFPFFWTVVSSPLGTFHFLDASEWASLSVPAGNPLRPQPTRVYGYAQYMGSTPEAGGVRLTTPPWSGPELYPHIANGTFILFVFKDNALVRSNEPLIVSGNAYLPIPSPAHTPPPKHFSRLHDILFRSHEAWPTYLKGRSYPN